MKLFILLQAFMFEVYIGYILSFSSRSHNPMTRLLIFCLISKQYVWLKYYIYFCITQFLINSCSKLVFDFLLLTLYRPIDNLKFKHSSSYYFTSTSPDDWFYLHDKQLRRQWKSILKIFQSTYQVNFNIQDVRWRNSSVVFNQVNWAKIISRYISLSQKIIIIILGIKYLWSYSMNTLRKPVFPCCSQQLFSKKGGK